MTAKIIEGTPIAERIGDELRRQVEDLRRAGHVPTLAGVLTDPSPAAQNFARSQRKACERIGIAYRFVRLESPTLPELQRTIAELAEDPATTGIVLHRPLPEHLDGNHVPTLIPAHKDVEGMHPDNLGRLLHGRGGLPPCTAMAAVELLRASGVPIEGKEAVVVGHSAIVGKPIALWLLDRLATTTVCHVATRDLALHTRRAEILFVAVGKAGLVNGEMVRPGAVVIDIGINRITEEGPGGKRRRRIVGDVDAPSVSEVAAHLTPVPGGVGPVTVAMLLRNTVRAARRQLGLGGGDEDSE
jgi:methylenetetrahydrofolate dehydrogenase (NADP+)/methenyltetrahydrofolate cyclohydrolase